MRIIHGEARRLASIVGDLFLLARRDAAEQTLTPQPLFLEELVGDCVDAIGSIAREKQVALEFLPVSEVPAVGDDAMLRRVIMNLLDNAIKYTPAGGKVRAEAEPRPGGGAMIRVTDTGRGIPPEHQARIFERFYRVQHTTDRSGLPDASGAGLGLPLAAWIAQAHGGALRLVRSDATGSVFEFTLPGGRGRGRLMGKEGIVKGMKGSCWKENRMNGRKTAGEPVVFTAMVDEATSNKGKWGIDDTR